MEKERRFIGFKVAVWVALFISMASLTYYLTFLPRHADILRNYFLSVLINIAALLMSFFYEILTLKFLAYIKRKVTPRPLFIIVHIILSIIVSLYIIYSMCAEADLVLKFKNLFFKENRLNLPQVLILIGIVIYFFSSAVSIIFSFRLRSFLKMQNIQKENILIEKLGEHDT